jgi:hypothetical protein
MCLCFEIGQGKKKYGKRAEAILSTFLTSLADESALFICEFAYQNK